MVKENFIGVSPSGKARDFDSLIRKFKSCYPCQQNRPTLVVGLFCWREYRFEHSAVRRVSSHTSPEDLQARLHGAGREYLRCANTLLPMNRPTLVALLFCWREYRFEHSAVRRVSSHTPPEDLQAGLHGAGREYLRYANTLLPLPLLAGGSLCCLRRSRFELSAVRRVSSHTPPIIFILK